MPMYDFRCMGCRRTTAVFRKIVHRDLLHTCEVCGSQAQRVLSAPRVVADYAGYSCPITGKWVEGRKAHRENLARHGCRILEPGEREAASRYRQSQEEALEISIGNTVEAEIHAMPAEKRDALAADLEHFSATPVRI